MGSTDRDHHHVSLPDADASAVHQPGPEHRRERSRQDDAHHFETATENATQDLRALQALTDTALSHLALHDLLPALLQRITEVLGVDNAVVLLLESTGQTLTMEAAAKLDEPLPIPVHIPVGRGVAGRIAETRAPFVVDDVTTFPIAVPLFQDQFQTLAGVPLEVEDQLLGVVLVGTTLARHFTPRDMQLLQKAADRMALAIDRARLYQAEQRAREQLDRIFEGIADGVGVYDSQARLVKLNAAGHRILGLDPVPADYAQRPLSDRISLLQGRDEQDSSIALEDWPLMQVLRGQATGAALREIRIHTLDGRDVELSISVAPLHDEDGRLIGAVGIFRDQTEQKRLERERAEQAEQLDRLFEGNADGLVLYDTQGQLVRLNAEARRILALDAAPAAYAQLSLPDRLQLYEAYDEQDHRLEVEELPAARVLSGQVKDADVREIRLRALDGRELELYVRAEPLRDERGRLTGAVIVMHDQTEQKRLTREREEAHARELAAERVAEQMSAFLATAAHDIRSPLTVATARVQMAMKIAERLTAALDAPVPTLTVTAQPPKLLAAETTESLQRAYAAMDQLKRLVNLLFDVTRAQTQQLVLELAPVDLRALVEELVAAQQLGTHGHRLRAQVPANAVLVEADADRLDEVLANFISNALKYSSANQPVTVQLEVVDHQAVVRVVDQGPGIPLEEQSRIWDPFYRSPEVPLQPGNRTEKGSLGLGLAICKQLIELHPGGNVGVESVVGKGATFWFRLPLAS
jgi:signal transduction histidine kinase